jgi:hypothetical protein
MKIKKFLESKYYGLEEVHAFNAFLRSLPVSAADRQIAEEIFRLSEIRGSYEDINKFVPGSESANKIAQTNKEYAEAQEQLKAYNYSREQLLDECYPDYIYLFKHTITYKVVQRYTHTEYYCADEDLEPTEVDVTVFFYSTGFYKPVVLMNPVDLSLPYENKQCFNSDIIQTYIDSYNYLKSRLAAHITCAERKWDVNTFLKVFNLDNVTIQQYMSTTVKICDNNGKIYWNADVEQLMAEYAIAQSKKYIRGDEYVEYPWQMSYVQFLEKLGVEYFESNA